MQNVTGSGLFVILVRSNSLDRRRLSSVHFQGADVVARVQICNLSDEFIKDFEKVRHFFHD